QKRKRQKSTRLHLAGACFLRGKEGGRPMQEFLQLVSQNDTNWRNCDIGEGSKDLSPVLSPFCGGKTGDILGLCLGCGRPAANLPRAACPHTWPQYMSIACFTKSAVPAPPARSI